MLQLSSNSVVHVAVDTVAGAGATQLYGSTAVTRAAVFCSARSVGLQTNVRTGEQQQQALQAHQAQYCPSAELGGSTVGSFIVM